MCKPTHISYHPNILPLASCGNFIRKVVRCIHSNLCSRVQLIVLLLQTIFAKAFFMQQINGLIMFSDILFNISLVFGNISENIIMLIGFLLLLIVLVALGLITFYFYLKVRRKGYTPPVGMLFLFSSENCIIFRDTTITALEDCTILFVAYLKRSLRCFAFLCLYLI